VKCVAADGDQRRFVARDRLVERQVVGKRRLGDQASDAGMDHAQRGLHLNETRFHQGAAQFTVVGGHPGHAQAQAGPPPFGQEERQQGSQPTGIGVPDGQDLAGDVAEDRRIPRRGPPGEDMFAVEMDLGRDCADWVLAAREAHGRSIDRTAPVVASPGCPTRAVRKPIVAAQAVSRW